MKSGVEQIADERQKQIDKHGFTGEHHADHPEWYELYQLSEAAGFISRIILIGVRSNCPINWDYDWWKRICEKPYQERLVIAGALIAAEIDRLQVLEARKEVSNG